MGLVPFDQGIFQDQGFKLTGRHNDLKIRHLLHHGGHLRKMLSVEVAADPVFELLGLADIDDFPPPVQHHVDAGEQRKLIGFIQKGFYG